jgi:DNA-binding LacI/PurR family transcriptional regulator
VLHLAQHRLIAGQDYAFISRDDDPNLDSMIPSVARYAVSSANVARRLFTLVMRVIKNPHAARRQIRLMPRFPPGESLRCEALNEHQERPCRPATRRPA